MGYTYDDSIVLPTNFVGVDPSPLNTGMGPTNSNLTNNAVADLKASIRGGKYQGNLDQSAGMPAVGPAGSVVWTSKSGRFYLSQNGLAWEGHGRTVVEKEWTFFGIKADGSDETAKLQSALNYFGNGGAYGTGITGKLILPPNGTIGISAECTYWGDVAHSILIEAASPSFTQGQTGCVVNWLGTTGANVALRMVGANGCIVRNVAFNGQSKCHDLLAWDNATVNGGGTMWGPSSYNFTEHCSFIDHGGTGCSCIRVGGVTNTQVSEVYVRKSSMVGRNAANDYTGLCFNVTTGANCKNFYVDDCQAGAAAILLNMGKSGSARVRGCGLGTFSQAAIIGGQLLTVEDCEQEGDITGAVKGVLIDQGPGSNGAIGISLFVKNFSATTSLPASGFTWPYDNTGTTPVNDVAIRSAGQAVLITNSLDNIRPSGTFPKLCVAVGVPGGVTSIGNFYQGAGATAPIYDSNGNDLINSAYASTAQQPIISLNDKGGTGASPIAMQLVMGQGVVNTQLQPAVSTPTAGTVYAGTTRRASAKVVVPYTAFQIAALTSDFTLESFNAGTRLCRVTANVTTPFAGPTGTITLLCGINGAGDAHIWGARDVKTATVIIGDAVADYAVSPGMGTDIAVGYRSSTMNSGIYSVVTRMTSSVGNLSGLTAGSVTFEIEYMVP